MQSYHWQSLTLDSLPNEDWEDIPGLDGHYCISSFGRVKREPYEMLYKNGRTYLLKAKIIKPRVVKLPNKFKGDFQTYVVNRVKLNGRRHNLSVARLVYHCFVKKVDLSDNFVVILFNDHNNFNICPSNLREATVKEKQVQMVSRKRFSSPFGQLTKSQKQNRVNALRKAKCKPVVQLNLEGEPINDFPSMAAAEAATGIAAQTIGLAASGGVHTAGGFRWEYISEPLK